MIIRETRQPNHMEKMIMERIVKKDEIIAVFNGRKEKEVIYIIHDIKFKPIPFLELKKVVLDSHYN
jgi:hypothetical protein